MKVQITAKVEDNEILENATSLITALLLTMVIVSLLVLGGLTFNVMNPALTSGVVSQQAK